MVPPTCQRGHATAVANPCIFCGQRKRSEDHIFPQWYSDWYKAEFTETALFGGDFVQENGRTRGRRKTHKINLKSDWICADCNTTWMSSMEPRAAKRLKPMMQGEAVRLFGVDTAALGTWAVLKAMVFDTCLPRPPFYRPQEHHRFRETQAPDYETTTVFALAHESTAPGWILSHDFSQAVGRTSVQPYLTTIALCRVALQVWSVRFHGPIESNALFANVDQEWFPREFLIWPSENRKSLRWPPSEIAGVESLGRYPLRAPPGA